VEEMRRNNAKRVEDLQKQLRERQEAVKNRGKEPPRVTIPRPEPPRPEPPRPEPSRPEPPRPEPRRGAGPRPNPRAEPPAGERGNGPPKFFNPRPERNEKKD
jgi:hypothetical protein